MAADSKPFILMIDDVHESSRPLQDLLTQRGRVVARVDHPQEVEPAILERADLVLMDWMLQHWPERDTGDLPLTLRPMTGLALGAVLRGHLKGNLRPTAFAIYSGELDQISPDVPPEPRVHVLAKMNNQEWVFQKGDPRQLEAIARQVEELAFSVRQLPDTLLPPKLTNFRSLLQLADESPWCERALEDIEKFRPPTFEMAALNYHLGILRWMLHRILPYPCFLLDEHRLAARLGVTVSSLREGLERSDAGLKRLLEGSEYRGILSGFLGRRWWRAGLAWMLDQQLGQNAPLTRIQDYVCDRVPSLQRVPKGSLVCVSQDEKARDGLYEDSEVVEVRFEDWPSEAEPAYMTIDSVKEDVMLRDLVVKADRSKLDAPMPSGT